MHHPKRKNKMAITVYSRFCIKSVLRINAAIKKKNLLGFEKSELKK